MKWQELREQLDADPQHRETLQRELPYRDLALVVAKMRAAEGLTQAEFANRVGMQQSVIARLESGRHAPNVKQLERIAAAFDRQWRVTFEPQRATSLPVVVQPPAWTFTVHPQPAREQVRHVVAAPPAIISLTIPASSATLSRTPAIGTDWRVMTLRDLNGQEFVRQARAAEQRYASTLRPQSSRSGQAVACSLAS